MQEALSTYEQELQSPSEVRAQTRWPLCRSLCTSETGYPAPWNTSVQ